MMRPLRPILAGTLLVAWALPSSTACRAQAVVAPVFATSLVPNSEVDSTAVWVAPGTGEGSLLFVTQKSGHRLEVRSAVTGLLDPERPFLGENGSGPGEFNRPNGVWVIPHVPLGEAFSDILIVTEQRNQRVQIFRLPSLEQIGLFGVGDLERPYGIAWYQDGSDFRLFITDNGVDFPKVRRYRLVERAGRIEPELELSFGQEVGEGSLPAVESVVVDPFRGWLHLCGDEGGEWNRIYTVEGLYTGLTYGDPQFEFDEEAINLYDLGGGRGYVIVSDQVTGGDPNEYEVFDRGTLASLGNFRSAPGPLITRNTDGAYLEQRPMPGFPNGAFYPVNNDVNVHVYDWTDIAEALGLEIAALDRPFERGESPPPASRAAVWFEDGCYWAVLPFPAGAAFPGGAALARLEDGTFAPRQLLDVEGAASVAARGEAGSLLLLAAGPRASLALHRYRPEVRGYSPVGAALLLPGALPPAADLETDGDGRAWIAWVEDGAAWVLATDGLPPVAWAGPPVRAAGASLSEVRLVRLAGGVGLLAAGGGTIVFRLHRDGSPAGTWETQEQVGLLQAAESLAAAPDGRGGLFAAASGSSGEIRLWHRSGAGAWREMPVGVAATGRLALLVDPVHDRLHLLGLTAGGGLPRVIHRQASLEAVLAGGGLPAEPALLLAWPGVAMGAPLVSRDPATAASGLVAVSLASDRRGYFARLSRPALPDITSPLTLQHQPPPGVADPGSVEAVTFRITDELSGVDRATLRVLVDGRPATLEVRGVSRNLLVRAPLPVTTAGEVAVRIEARDLASPPNVMAPFEYRFRPGLPRASFRRGDANADGADDIADAVAILLGLFGGLPLPCRDAADADGNSSIDLTDAVVLLDHLFLRGLPLPPPWPACGPDPGQDGPGCQRGGCP